MFRQFIVKKRKTMFIPYSSLKKILRTFISPGIKITLVLVVKFTTPLDKKVYNSFLYPFIH